MANSTQTIVISGAMEAVQSIHEFINAQLGGQSHLTERKNLDGSAAAWIVIATITGQALPQILGVVKDYLATKQVRKIKVGDWEAENPTREMVDVFLARIKVSAKTEEK